MTLYDMIEKHVAEKLEAERFFSSGLSDGTLMRLKDGSIRPRYCQYCVENYDRQIVPRIQGWEFNLSDEEIEIIRNACMNDKNVFSSFWNDVNNKLKNDTGRLNFLSPWLVKGRQYACFCDCCGICSGWYLSQKDATDEFDRIVREQIEYTRNYD